MQIEIISFTEQGSQQAEKIKNCLKDLGEVHAVSSQTLEQPLQEWCREVFVKAQLLIFVGAVGIAVRTIAPFIKDKFTDPAVLAADEKGNFVIPLLSGHVGRANEYAQYLAEELMATAVITTATDLNGAFAVDVFARKNHLVIRDRVWAKGISAGILRGERISFCCEGEVKGALPKELVNDTSLQSSGSENKNQILVGIHPKSHLIPQAVTLGIGCRKGKPAEEIEHFILEKLEQEQIAMESIMCVASVDRKENEPGIVEFCRKYGLPFRTFSVRELKETEGEFAESDFVKTHIGVDNVCERAAVCAQNGERVRLILPKTAENGMTLAIAEREWSVSFA